MPGVETAILPATCLDLQTGSTTIFVNGNGITRVGLDNAGGGVITGPGSTTVFAEGAPVSLPGDIILPHPPCDSGNPHCVATTNLAGSPNVFSY